MGHRVCSKCKTNKPLTEFRKDSPAFENLSKKNKFPEEYQHLAWGI